MTRFLFALPLLLAAGCATTDRDLGPLVRHPVYEAIGGPPSWRLAIGDDIALRLGHDSFPDVEVAFVIYRYPRVLSRETDGVRRWHSTTRGGASLIIEVRPGPCAFGEGPQFEDHVRVVQGDRMLNGCGGRLLPREGTR